MKLFLNIALPFLVMCTLIYIFWNIREILRGLLESSIRAIKESIPGLIVRGIIELILTIKKKNTGPKATSTNKSENPSNTIRIEPPNFNKFIIIKGYLAKSEIEKTIREACSHFEELDKLSFEYKTKEYLTILDVNGVESMYLLAYITQYLSTDYGTDNIYAYLESQQLSLFFYLSPEDNNELLGQTNAGKTFTFSTEDFDTSNNSLKIRPYRIKPELSTNFFRGLVQSP